MPPAAPPRASWLDRQLLRELPAAWRWAYFWFALSLILVLGTQWMVNPVKLTVFKDLVGFKHEPLAKSLDPIVLIPILFIYNFCFAAFGSSKILVVFICTFYAAIYGFIAVTLAANGGHASPWLAWVLYFATD